MEFKLAQTTADWLACNNLVAYVDYYDPMQLELLGGMVIMAVSDTGEVAGCVWLNVHGTVASLDYLAALPAYTGVGMRLLNYVREQLEKLGLHEVRFEIHESNAQAMRIASAFGAKLHGPYYVGRAKLGDLDGQEEG